MSERREFAAIVLAAGQGTRMKSDRPKVLHEVAGRPMVFWPVRAALDAGAARVVVVVGHGRAQVEDALAARFDERVGTAVQEEQLGTGHAARCALPALEGFEGDAVILYGDVPLIEPEAVEALIDARGEAPLSLLTCTAPDPRGYGRILRDERGAVTGIREHRDCSEDELTIDEINPGLYACEIAFLRTSLGALSDDNAQGELYLTDIVEAAAGDGGAAAVPWPLESLQGVNDRAQLAEVSATMRRRIATRHARAGVTIRDLARVDIDADVTLGADAIVEPGVTLRGDTHVGARAHLDVGCVLTDVRVAEDAYLKPYTVATDSAIGAGARVGPFSHLRPGSDLGPEVHVGNFVETKKTKLGRGAKANHLAYLGDGLVEAEVNVGAGVIFCNYDGFQKHLTHLEEGSFIGSDSQLVAPIRVGKGAYVATGTTVTKDVPADALAVGRARQSNKEGYAPRLRARLKASAEKAKKRG
ncbi:MAG TPA: bifunctional UDP-N-acetylglucosamine diphosphorylase/glucosamine-1-phosphate N-acetyltransferase GlmU [Sandaracinaceae bacterium LLY-WYZ-13_1]|nr:bifunctional UDP-N-acetylglucosamine diphosphorylase/glucosamine-1-phosphate N-acetyltransferase GlmU [Sandaracinaceae bacterium LLY-WYZ-13_1]